MVSKTNEELDKRDVVGGVHHATNIVDRKEGIHIDITELILHHTGTNIDTVDSKKSTQVCGFLE